jgi:putative endonuclease
MEQGMPLIHTRSRAELGQWAEDHAARALERRGYVIIARRYRTRFGEIDLIARDRETLVFIEVKSRRTTTCGSPAAGVTAQKQRRLLRLAAQYLQQHQALGRSQCRFDVVSVWCPNRHQPARIEILRAAFDQNSSPTC